MMRNHAKFRGNREILQLNVMCDPSSDHEFRKIISKGYYWNSLNVNCQLYRSISSILNLFILRFLKFTPYISFLIWDAKYYCLCKKIQNHLHDLNGCWLPSLFHFSTWYTIPSRQSCLRCALSLSLLSFIFFQWFRYLNSSFW